MPIEDAQDSKEYIIYTRRNEFYTNFVCLYSKCQLAVHTDLNHKTLVKIVMTWYEMI